MSSASATTKKNVDPKKEEKKVQEKPAEKKPEQQKEQQQKVAQEAPKQQQQKQQQNPPEILQPCAASAPAASMDSLRMRRQSASVCEGVVSSSSSYLKSDKKKPAGKGLGFTVEEGSDVEDNAGGLQA